MNAIVEYCRGSSCVCIIVHWSFCFSLQWLSPCMIWFNSEGMVIELIRAELEIHYYNVKSSVPRQKWEKHWMCMEMWHILDLFKWSFIVLHSFWLTKGGFECGLGQRYSRLSEGLFLASLSTFFHWNPAPARCLSFLLAKNLVRWLNVCCVPADK